MSDCGSIYSAGIHGGPASCCRPGRKSFPVFQVSATLLSEIGSSPGGAPSICGSACPQGNFIGPVLGQSLARKSDLFDGPHSLTLGDKLVRCQVADRAMLPARI